jgi:DNA-binding MarR family transcriptional regulator
MRKMTHDLQVSVMRLARRLRAERGDHGLTLSQLSVLATLHRHGAMTSGELAAHERVQPPSMTRTVANLVADGLLERKDNPEDRRQVLLRLTKAGTELLASDRARREAWLTCRMSEITADERQTLARAAVILDRLAGS